MKVEEIVYDGLRCVYCRYPDSDKAVYILYPMDSLDQWIESAAMRFKTTIVAITGMDWDNDLTPWKAPGVPKDSPMFEGRGMLFLDRLTEKIIPYIEKLTGFINPPERTLIGVSLSGLFTLWQWAVCGYFKNIATLSGSFWYENFVKWIYRHSFNQKTGDCFMLLGEAEPYSKNKVFASVGECTDEIVKYLRQQNVKVSFQTVNGNHYQHPIERLDIAMSGIFFPLIKPRHDDI